MDLPEIGPVSACEMAFKNEEALWKAQIVLLQYKKKAKERF